MIEVGVDCIEWRFFMVPIRPFVFLKKFIAKQKIIFLSAQAFCLGYALDQTYFPVLFGQIIDAISCFQGDRMNGWDFVGPPILYAMFFWLFMETSYRFSGFLLARCHPRLQESIRLHAFGVLHQKSNRYFSKEFTGALSQRANDLALGTSRLCHTAMTIIIPALVGIILCGVFLYKVSPRFCFIIELWVCCHIGITIWMSNVTSKSSKNLGEARSKLTGAMVDSLSNHLLVKVSSREEWELDYLKGFQRKEKNRNHAVLYTIEKFRIILGLFTFLGPGLLIGACTYQSWKYALISLGEVVLIFNITWNITGLIWQIGNELPDFFTQIGVVDQALEILSPDHEMKDDDNAPLLSIQKGEIIFNNVNFFHNEHHILFHDLSITISPGEKVGLVGQSGGGKSSFVNLIMRLFDLSSGEILIDGQDISKCTQKSLRSQIAYLPQNLNMFQRRIYDNIKYSAPHASYEEVVEAAKLAHAHEFIENLPEGYDTFGDQLSGGQKQRINLARVFLQAKHAKILIVDEGTSALDPETESYVREGLKKLMENRTSIVIAHRPGTLEDMDRILVFAHGKIIQDVPKKEWVGFV
jgi:ATP-binding cassette subfamily B protein